MSDDPTQQASTARPALDPMFPQLVRDADTPEQKLIGFIAYGLYEEARREWATDFRDREGRYPVEDELRAYERSWTASRLDGIRNAAVQLVAAYADTLAKELETEVLRGALKGRFWRSVGRWLFSAILYTLALTGIFVALGRSGIDPIARIRDLATPAPVAGPVPEARGIPVPETRGSAAPEPRGTPVPEPRGSAAPEPRGSGGAPTGGPGVTRPR